MKISEEIEFKCAIPEDKYNELIKEFKLENNIFVQKNYYFDTDNLDLIKRKIVLRIRQKSEKYYKVTLKSEGGENLNFEKHILLQEDEAKEMISKGFRTINRFPEIDYFVSLKATLNNSRVTVPHEVGTLFFDKCEYSNKVDYEVEYEVDDYITGKKVFEKFLRIRNIPECPTKRKSVRALEAVTSNIIG